MYNLRVNTALPQYCLTLKPLFRPDLMVIIQRALLRTQQAPTVQWTLNHQSYCVSDCVQLPRKVVISISE